METSSQEFDIDVPHKCKVLIIGAGASGLYAAHCFVKRDITSDIVILEAEERIGGRIHTIPFNGHYLELGAQWIHGRGDNPLWKFVHENKIPLADRANRDSEGLYLRIDGQEPPMEILEETLDFLWSLHEEANKFSRNPDYSQQQTLPKSMGHYFEEQFTKWLESKKKSEQADVQVWRKQLFNWFIKFEECDTGCDDFYKHSCISWGEYLDYGQDASFAQGYKSILDKMVSQLNKVKILKNHKVTKVQYDSNAGVRVQTENGALFQADHVICTLSLGVLKSMHDQLFYPALPRKLTDAIESISFGAIDRIKLDFQEAFWDLEDPGLILVQTDEKRMVQVDETNWFKHIFSFDEVLYHPTTLQGWISGEAARFMETLTDDQIAQDVCQYLEEIMQKHRNEPEWKLPKLKQIVVTRWFTNGNFRGVYSYRNQESDAKSITNKDLSLPICDDNGCPRVLFAGEATDADHYGTVHGAMSSAEREVLRLQTFWKNNQ